jgi:hypothetical protein
MSVWVTVSAVVASLGSAGVASAASVTVPCDGQGGGPAGLASAIRYLNSAGGGDITLAPGCTYLFTTADNYWYGPNALPPIASAITIHGNGSTLQRDSLSPKFRFFFVGADANRSETSNYVSPGPGRLTLEHLLIKGGWAHGGNSGTGGGGAGLGGAIFSQGQVNIEGCTFTVNWAQGGSSGTQGLGAGGGGIGQDAGAPTDGGGFGGAVAGGQGGGQHGTGGGGGGAGFRSTSDNAGGDGGSQGPGSGGGTSNGTGGNGMGGGHSGDGSGGGGYSSGIGTSETGGGFGAGGYAGTYGGGGGGGGVGGGGGGIWGDPLNQAAGAGGGGFGGGGGSPIGYGLAGDGGFAAGGGISRLGGFGGGDGGQTSGGGGAGMGGAIFNMQGTLTVTDSTFYANSAVAGKGANPGAAVGGAIANLNGAVTIDSSTLAFNVAPDGGGAVADFGYDGATARSATVVLERSIASNTANGAPDVAVNSPGSVANGNSNVSFNDPSCGYPPCPKVDVDITDHNIVGMNLGGFGDSSITGSNGTPTNPQYGPDPQLASPSESSSPLQDNGGGVPTLMPALRSPARDAAGMTGCPEYDERGIARPQGPACDIGAVELDPTPPAAPVLTGTDPTSPSASTNPEILGSRENGTTVWIYAGGDCEGTPVIGEPAGPSSFAVAVTVQPGSTTTFHAKAVRSDQSTSACSTTSATYAQRTPLPPGPQPAPAASVNVSSLDFGDIVLGLTSRTRTVTLSNTGTAALTVSAVSISGGTAGDFAKVSDRCSGTTLAIGGACTEMITFRPSYFGARTSTLSFSDNASGSPQTVALSGNGVAAAAGAPYSVQSVTVKPDGTTTIVLVPQTAGTATLTVTVPTASVSSAGKRCKPGYTRIKGRCRPASTVVAVVRASARPGVPLKLTIVPSGSIKSALRRGKTVHAAATLVYQPAGGGEPTVTVRHIVFKPAARKPVRRHRRGHPSTDGARF